MPKTTLSNRSTIKNDPFAAIIPVQGTPMDPSPDEVCFHHPAAARPLGRKKLTVHLQPDLIERVKNAAYWNPRLTIAAIAEAGIRQALTEVEREHGGPYPPREQELRGGRPIK